MILPRCPACASTPWGQDGQSILVCPQCRLPVSAWGPLQPIEGLRLIVAADDRDGIGLNGGLPWSRLPKDMARFKALTSGCAIIMGGRTWDSIQRAPLPGRVNVVLTRHDRIQRTASEWRRNGRDVYAAATPGEALAAAKERTPSGLVWVVGGSSIYRVFAHWAEELHLTRIHYIFSCDTYLHPETTALFPVVDRTMSEQDGVFQTTYSILRKRPLCAASS